LDAPGVSRRHALVRVTAAGATVEDLGSTNGTYVNGSPVEGVVPLGFGDVIQIGQVRLRLERPRPSARR
jgi:pSer/pThr/pTyr-binding forkhead associated (FHA) protein